MSREVERDDAVVAAMSAQVAVREVYDAHYGTLVGWAATLVNDRDLAKEIVIAAFVRLLRHRAGTDEPRAWLYATVSTIVRDHWRQRARQAPAHDTFQAGIAEAGGDDIDQATCLTVQEVVSSLPERLQLPVLLHCYADLPIAQTARQLNTSEGSIQRDLYDARHKIAALLQEGQQHGEGR